MVQPFVHQLSCVLRAPVQIWSATDGQSDGTGAQGIYLADERVVSRARLTVHGYDVDHTGHRVAGSTGVFESILRTPTEGADPVVALTRTRVADADGVSEVIGLASAGEHTHQVRLSLELLPDHAPLELIKAGRAQPAPAITIPDDATWSWRDGQTRARLSADGQVRSGEALHVEWDVTLAPGDVHELNWRLDVSADDLPFVAPVHSSLARPAARRPDLDRLLAASRADLESLLLCEPDSPQWSFAAAGAPWFLTLFGRDSLITASMLARSNPQLALGTLHTLAARLGTRVDEARAEAPGKVLHEVRRVALDLQDDATVLPPEYYGTIDATLLWIMLLGEVTEGVGPGALMDPLLQTLGWLRDHADPDGDGFLEYFDTSGHGLANQGWKDSGDSIRFADGTIAEGPIVLLEVQGYAYSAARVAARILAAHGRDEAERAAAGEWNRYADDMANRIRERFWVRDETGPYPAIALDHEKRPVTGVASNMGHLLGTGVLTEDEERIVVDRLVDPSMFSGYGIRTMSTTNGAYWPWRYHVGSVWTHDTAWILRGMHRAGFTDESRLVAEGLLRALDGFANRAPELFGGQSSDEGWPPLPYPASCRPQAWAAASAWVLAEVLGR